MPRCIDRGVDLTVVEPATKGITLERIDADDLQDVEDIPEAVRFSVLLSEEPSAAWKQEFTLAYRAMPNAVRPPVQIEGDRLWIAYLPRYSADLESYLRYLKAVVERA